jgi:hypothetical protein
VVKLINGELSDDYSVLKDVFFQLLDLSTRSAKILSRVQTLSQVLALPSDERTKLILTARFVIEHDCMFAEKWVRRAEVIAYQTHFDGEPTDFVPTMGRHVSDASFAFEWHDQDSAGIFDERPLPYYRGDAAEEANRDKTREGPKSKKAKTQGGVTFTPRKVVTAVPYPEVTLAPITGSDIYCYGGHNKLITYIDNLFGSIEDQHRDDTV